MNNVLSLKKRRSLTWSRARDRVKDPYKGKFLEPNKETVNWETLEVGGSGEGWLPVKSRWDGAGAKIHP